MGAPDKGLKRGRTVGIGNERAWLYGGEGGEGTGFEGEEVGNHLNGSKAFRLSNLLL